MCIAKKGHCVKFPNIPNYVSVELNLSEEIAVNPVDIDTEGAIESVHINRVSVVQVCI